VLCLYTLSSSLGAVFSSPQVVSSEYLARELPRAKNPDGSFSRWDPSFFGTFCLIFLFRHPPGPLATFDVFLTSS